MNHVNFIVNLIDLKAKVFNRIRIFKNNYSIEPNNIIDNFYGKLLDFIFGEFILIVNYSKITFNNLKISSNHNLQINSIPHLFTNLAINSIQINIPNNNQNIKIFNYTNNINFSILNSNKKDKNFEKDFNISFSYIPAIKYQIKSNISFKKNSLTSPIIPIKGNLYKILKFLKKETFLYIFHNHIKDDEQITNYELHVENVSKKIQYYYLLIEFNENLTNKIYLDYEMSFRGQNKAAYVKFLNKKGPIEDPEEI